MDWPFGRRRRFSFFDEIDEEFERMREDMERMFEEMGKQPGSKVKRYGPYVYGFSMRTGPDGKPIIEEFGNIRPPSRELPSGEREPLVDIIDEEKQITVIAELPGVEKEDIKVKVVGKNLNIKVETEARRYSKTIALPAEVKPESAKASYKNGVLEVRLEKKAPTKETGSEIKVE